LKKESNTPRPDLGVFLIARRLLKLIQLKRLKLSNLLFQWFAKL
jgi:hypothetical protein